MSQSFSRISTFARKWLGRAIKPSFTLEGIIQQDASAIGTPLRIWPIGDSITEAQTGYSSYRYWLWNMLEDAGYRVQFVGSKSGVLGGEPRYPQFDQSHDGYFGYRTDDVVPLIGATINRIAFDAALIHLGTNDLGHGESPEQIVGELSSLIQVLRKRNSSATILLAQIIPTIGGERRMSELNEAIVLYAARASTEQSKIIAVDHFTGFDPSIDTYDGIHPTEEGEEKIAARWFKALQSCFTSSPSAP